MVDGAGAREDKRGNKIEPVEGETDTPHFTALRTDPIIEGKKDFPLLLREGRMSSGDYPNIDLNTHTHTWTLSNTRTHTFTPGQHVSNFLYVVTVTSAGSFHHNLSTQFREKDM